MSIPAIASLVILAIHALGTIALALVLARGRSGRAGDRFTPRVTILKPLKGLDDGLRSNIESFFGLDYPDFEILFGIEDEHDPAVPIVRELVAQHPGVRARLILGGQDQSVANPKVRTILHLLEFARSDFVLVSDSNVRVRPDHLLGVMAPFSDPRVGLVTNIVAGVGERTLGSTLENIHLSGFISMAQATARVYAGLVPVIGKSLAIRLEALEQAGGLKPLGAFLAEDYMLGRLVAAKGWKAVLSGDTVDNHNAHAGIHNFLDRHYRWLGMRWRIQPLTGLLELFTIPTPWILAWMLVSPGQLPACLGMLAAFALLEHACALMTRRGRVFPAHAILLSPIKDMCHMLVLVSSLFNDKVNWRGNVFRLSWRTRITRLPATERKALPPFLMPMRMGDEWPAGSQSPWRSRAAEGHTCLQSRPCP